MDGWMDGWMNEAVFTSWYFPYPTAFQLLLPPLLKLFTQLTNNLTSILYTAAGIIFFKTDQTILKLSLTSHQPFSKALSASPAHPIPSSPPWLTLTTQASCRDPSTKPRLLPGLFPAPRVLSPGLLLTGCANYSHLCLINQCLDSFSIPSKEAALYLTLPPWLLFSITLSYLIIS